MKKKTYLTGFFGIVLCMLAFIGTISVSAASSKKMLKNELYFINADDIQRVSVSRNKIIIKGTFYTPEIGDSHGNFKREYYKGKYTFKVNKRTKYETENSNFEIKKTTKKKFISRCLKKRKYPYLMLQLSKGSVDFISAGMHEPEM